jgi:hypothetical protein
MWWVNWCLAYDADRWVKVAASLKSSKATPFVTEGNGVDNSNLFPGCSEKKNHDFPLREVTWTGIPSLVNARDGAKQGKQQAEVERHSFSGSTGITKADSAPTRAGFRPGSAEIPVASLCLRRRVFSEIPIPLRGLPC